LIEQDREVKALRQVESPDCAAASGPNRMELVWVPAEASEREPVKEPELETPEAVESPGLAGAAARAAAGVKEADVRKGL